MQKEEKAKIAETVYGVGKSLAELKKGECCWPTGDSPFIFCSAKTNQQYCQKHAEASVR